jgi:alkaline phosphatase D
MAVEFVTPAISSPPFFTSPEQRERARQLAPLARHLKFLEGEHRGYVLLDLTKDRLQAEWYHVATVSERSTEQTKAAGFVCERDSSRLAPA